MKFEAGRTYWYSFITDEAHAKIYLEIVSRTAKSAVIRHDGEQTTQRKKIYTDENGDEWLRPNGTYSMCPVCRANHTDEPEAENLVNLPTSEYPCSRDEVETESTMTDLETALEGKVEREEVEEILEKFSETTLKEYMQKEFYLSAQETCEGWNGWTKADFVEAIAFHVAMKSQGLRGMHFI